MRVDFWSIGRLGFGNLLERLLKVRPIGEPSDVIVKGSRRGFDDVFGTDYEVDTVFGNEIETIVDR